MSASKGKEDVEVGDTVFRMLDDDGFPATVQSVDHSRRTMKLVFDDGAEESDVDFDEIEIEDPDSADAEQEAVAVSVEALPPAIPQVESGPENHEVDAAAAQHPGVPPPADNVPETTTEKAEKPLTMSQMMARLSAQVDAFAKEQENLKQKFAEAHQERHALTEEVRLSRERVAEQEAEVDRAAREYQLADMQLKRAEADIDMALKRAVPFLTGVVNDYGSNAMTLGGPQEAKQCVVGGGGGGNKEISDAVPRQKQRLPRAAIVTTVRFASSEVIAAFCRWHLYKGFAHIYLFFEDPQEAFHFKQYLRQHLTAIAQTVEEDAQYSWMKLLSGESLSIIVTDAVDSARADAVYMMQKRDTALMKTSEAHLLKTEIMSRQCLNAEIAALRAATHPSHSGGPMDWLLHIDIDELFLVSSPNSWEQPPSVGHHFASIPSSVDYVAYVNHEAVPEHTRNVTNYFTEISLFKQNPNVFKRQAQEAMLGDTSVAGLARKFWSERAKAAIFPDPESAPIDMPKTYFLAYANGKSAVRLRRPGATSAVTLPVPLTVHRWRGQDVVGTYWHPKEACVLHYAHCGPACFQKKFQLLKVARTDWWHRLPLYKAAVAICDNAEMSRELYEHTVCLTNSDEAAKQQKAGVCIRILQVQDVLKSIGF